ncbi:hypothetical protein [Pseudomonas amygdali]|uniref:Uncharacterized protein n=2 Tax=Pseudomonas amygdali pv. lachrymans TaxID=53707 RepID=A0ABR5KSM7_PSEAV|nr:hypothetical protein [Pseudomonas amygdali]AXH60255.1 hypothetical protein PLA107_034275 [Pseudomonas amygdali pv. lachrymans str. M301315]KPC17650.1 Uncharacterized protein AC499_0852 [Pseudomonas amygdali pv. lachrymans]RMT06426.1 hypothetical protein ALP54_04081 [Pseudomonas amygdali pv. lachrymans]
MTLGEPAFLQALVLDVSNSTLFFEDQPLAPSQVLQVLDADLAFKIESPAFLSLQTIYRLLKNYPLLQHINGFASDFMQHASDVKPRLGLVAVSTKTPDGMGAPEPVRLNLVKITSVKRCELSFVEQVLMNNPTETVSGVFISDYKMVFDDKPTIDVAVDVSLTAHLGDKLPQASVGDYYVNQLYHKPIHLLAGRMVDHFYPANAERLAPDYQAVQETVTETPGPDLTLADLVHTCLSLNYNTAEERALIKAEEDEQKLFFERLDRLMEHHVENLDPELS